MAVTASGELRVVNPATLEVVGSVTATDPRAVQGVVDDAAAAAERWAAAAPAERRALLVRVGEAVLDRADEIADVVVSETAKPRQIQVKVS